MQFRKTPVAVAAFALFAAMPLAAQAQSTPAPSSGSLGIWFKAPGSGATVSGVLNGGTSCYANGSGPVSRVVFSVDGATVNTDSTPADGMQCVLDTTKLANGTHSLRADAYDSSGNRKSDIRSITVQNTANQPPTVSMTGPSSDRIYSGNLSYSAGATDDAGVARVVFFLDGSASALATDTSAPYGGSIDTTKLVNGTHTIKAVAYDAQGLSASSQVSFTIQNTSTTTTGGSTSTSGGTTTTAGATPAPSSGSLDIWFKAPGSGATVSGVLNGGTSCYANGSGPVSRVVFSVDGTTVNTDSTPADGMQCVLDTTKLANGTHSLRADAYDSSGNRKADIRSITVQNIVNQPPTVSMTGPSSGVTYSGNLSYSANAADDSGVAKVDFFLDGSTSALLSDPSAPYGGSVDTTKLANGTHTLVATAYDAQGLKASSQVSFNVQNSTTSTGSSGSTTSTPAPSSGSLDVWFKSPLNGSTVSGVLNGGTNCYANSSGSVARVAFKVDATALNTDSTPADGTQCLLDTTKLANGTHSLRADAFDASGNMKSDIVSINVQNATSTSGGSTSTSGGSTSTSGSGSTASKPANLLFWSGFENGVSLQTPTDCYGNGCWQSPAGTDSTTGFTWPFNLDGGTNKWQLIVNGPTPTPDTVGDYLHNELQTVVGHKGTPTRALYSEISQSGCCGTNPQGNGSTQNDLLMMPAKEPGDIYISKWIKLQPDLLDNLHSGDAWRSIFEWKEGTSDNGAFRISLQIVAYNGTPLTWMVRWDNLAGPVPSYQEYYRKYNTTVPVPVGQWFKLELFWHRSAGNDGRTWFAVNGQVIDDHYGPNISSQGTPIGRIFSDLVYTGGPYPSYQWADDIQVWQGFPTVSSSDPWYDPPYAPH